MREAIEAAWSKGAVIVIAAGNFTIPLCSEPAAADKVICVGAVDPYDLRTFYSQGDATMTKNYLVAPGGAAAVACESDILSTVPRRVDGPCSPAPGYSTMAGTSMAAPFVSGVAALLAGQGLSNEEIVVRLTSTTDDLGTPGRDPLYGFGLVNALQAVKHKRARFQELLPACDNRLELERVVSASTGEW